MGDSVQKNNAWLFSPVKDEPGAWKIVLESNSKFSLTVFRANFKNNQEVILCNDGKKVQSNNKWVLKDDGRIVLKDRPSFALTVSQNQIQNGTQLVIHDGGKAQSNNKWEREKNPFFEEK